MTGTTPSPPTLLSLPTELRLQIVSYVFEEPPHPGFKYLKNDNITGYRGLVLDHCYSSSASLSIVLACRQFHRDCTEIAFRRTTFVVTDIFSAFQLSLQPLQQYQIASLRCIAFVASDRQFRELVHWSRWPFDMEALHLDELTIVLHQSANCLYPSDYTRDMVTLLRRLENVKLIKFVQNAARVKGFFRTWYNRLIGLMLKEDHFQRYDAPNAPNVEKTWWEWTFCDDEKAFELAARPPKVVIEEEEYMSFVAPMVQKLMSDMEFEEVDVDPRATNGA